MNHYIQENGPGWHRFQIHDQTRERGIIPATRQDVVDSLKHHKLYVATIAIVTTRLATSSTLVK
jgi:hypothetical protein